MNEALLPFGVLFFPLIHDCGIFREETSIGRQDSHNVDRRLWMNWWQGLSVVLCNLLFWISFLGSPWSLDQLSHAAWDNTTSRSERPNYANETPDASQRDSKFMYLSTWSKYPSSRSSNSLSSFPKSLNMHEAPFPCPIPVQTETAMFCCMSTGSLDFEAHVVQRGLDVGTCMNASPGESNEGEVKGKASG